MDKNELWASACRYRYAIAPYGSSNREVLWVSLPVDDSHENVWRWYQVCADRLNCTGNEYLVKARLVDLQDELLT